MKIKLTADAVTIVFLLGWIAIYGTRTVFFSHLCTTYQNVLAMQNI